MSRALPVSARLQGTGEDEDDVESSSRTLEQTEEGFQPVFFSPRPLRNLAIIDEMPGMAPVTDMKVGAPRRTVPRRACATGRRRRLRRHPFEDDASGSSPGPRGGGTGADADADARPHLADASPLDSLSPCCRPPTHQPKPPAACVLTSDPPAARV